MMTTNASDRASRGGHRREAAGSRPKVDRRSVAERRPSTDDRSQQLRHYAETIGPIVILCLAFLFILWKCPFGFGDADEGYYLSVPMRLCLGDGLIIHDWQTPQLSAFLLYPFVSLFWGINGGFTGALLAFRYLYSVVWAATAFFVFFRMRSINVIGALVAALYFLIYAPFGIMALSYNTMGIMLLVWSCTIAATAKTHRRIQSFIGGVLFFGAVICCPYLIVVAVLFSLAFLVVTVVKRPKDLLSRLMPLIFFALGALALAIVFVAFILSRASIDAIVSSLPYILSDPTHQATSLKLAFNQFFQAISTSSTYFWASLVLLFIALGIRKRTVWRKWAGFILACLSTMVLLFGYMKVDPYINYIMFPLNILGLYCGLSSEDKATRRLFWCMLLPGFMYAFCLNYSSNQVFYAISSASTVSGVACAVMAFRHCRELLDEMPETKGVMSVAKVLGVALLACLCVGQIGSELYMRYASVYSVYWEPETMQDQTQLETEGPESGLLISPERARYYENIAKDLDSVKADDSVESLVCVSESPWMYLIAEKQVGAYGPWLETRYPIEWVLDKLDAYYQMNPDKKPDAVFIEAGIPNFDSFMSYFKDKGYDIRQTSSGNYYGTYSKAS